MPAVLLILSAAAALTTTAANLVQICRARNNNYKERAVELERQLAALKIQNAYRRHVQRVWTLGPLKLETDRYFK